MDGLPGNWPVWVPDAARHYLSHTEHGAPIRALARQANIHASTVLRQVRRFESRRDDPLVDAALSDLAHRAGREKKRKVMPETNQAALSAEQMRQETQHVLRRMSEPGAVLAIATGMEMGVVVRDGPSGETLKTVSVDRRVAQAMALNELISCDDPAARICRYRITAAGRSELRALMAAVENGAQGFAEGQARFEGATPVSQNRRMALADSPLVALSRRRDKDGSPFLSRDLVAAGERLREDFELARMTDDAPGDWLAWLEAGAEGGAGPQARLGAALLDLGDGLGEVALRCCCLLEGMEAIEARMSWSARSGKIVLRIALQQLKRHYDAQGQGSAMIG